MAEVGFLQSLGIIAVCAAIMVAVGRTLKMPAIVVYLLCGILLGPVLGWVGAEEGLDLISETGIALLLFLVGMELSIGKIRDVGKVALVAGSMQVVLTAGYHREPGGPVSELMVTDVETVDADMNIIDLAELFIATRFRRFPVLKDNRLVGQISRRDVLRALGEISSH